LRLIKDEIYNYLSKQQSPIGLKRLEQHLKLHRRERGYLRMILKEMIRDGKVCKTDKQCYQAAEKAVSEKVRNPVPEIRAFISGVLINGKGGFHVETPKRRRAIRVKWLSEMQGKPVQGDRVWVVETGKNTGIVAGIDCPEKSRSWGRLFKTHFVPATGRRGKRILPHEAGKGEVVEIQAGIRPRVLARFRESPASAVSIAAYRHNLFQPWPELEISPEFQFDTPDRRTDLTHLAAFTIDGEDAKDFDDAISLEKQKNRYILGIHIADVSAYVEQNSAVDRNAMLRGVSAYLPNHTVSMLPEELSNNRCSLLPGKSRLCLSLLFVLNRQFEIENFSVVPSRIQSRFRLQYKQVNHWLNSEETVNRDWGVNISESLRMLVHFADSRRKKRKERGAVFLNIPKGKLQFNSRGHVDDILPETEGKSQRIVEECMLLANESVGNLFVNHHIPGIFRIHPKPAAEIYQVLEQVKRELRLTGDTTSISSFINETNDPKLHYIFLRMLGRARYDSEPGCHFGLAAENYLHFTSPIRRYADLVVHRMLKAWLNRVPAPYTKPQLAAIADLVSFRETVSFHGELDAAESMILNRIKQGKEREFNGIVSAVGKAGIFVELSGFFVDGFVPLSTLTGQYRLSPSGFSLENSRGHQITIGLAVRVRITEIDPLLRILKLQIVDKSL